MFSLISRYMLPLGPVIAAIISAICHSRGLNLQATYCLAVAIVCALWWIFECAHIAIVGLIPFVAFPLLGVIDHRQVAQSYGHTMILLLMGGFFLSAAMEKSGAHRRIALTMVRAVGGKGGRRLVLGFMLATSMLSMWISNAATTLMILPIALAVLAQANDPKLRTPMLLGIAYAASIGGMATPIGTPPNVVFMGYMEDHFPDSQISFAGWMMIGLPIVAMLFPAIWLWVTRGLSESKPVEMPEVGPWRTPEIRVLIVFAATAMLWMFRTGPFGGWSSLIPGGQNVGDTTVALAASMFLFLCPTGEVPSTDDHPHRSTDAAPSAKDRDTLLDWETAAKIPWGILIMFGGGLALAVGFKETQLSESIGQQLNVFSDAPIWVIILSVCLLVTFLTEITSSTATATLLMPILAELALATGSDPTSIMIPGTISASCAFMLPVATAPNVIIFGAGGIRTDEMARNGIVLNLFAAAVITSWTYYMLG